MALKSCLDIDEAMYMAYLEAWGDEKMVPYAVSLRADNFQLQREKWLYEASDAVLKDGFVPAELYFLVEEDKIIGAIHLRLSLNDFLLKHGGHIGYGVRPDERKKGYADLMMHLINPILEKHHLDKVLLTCDEDNIGSNKTIQKHGGILENQSFFEGKLTNRYWIAYNK
ncbi:MAG: GNAT family N-acetyltransferase [Clostridia bacterium]|nr:GNAT family N-acetyltransferase [Clostridia bacterium]